MLAHQRFKFVFGTPAMFTLPSTSTSSCQLLTEAYAAQPQVNALRPVLNGSPAAGAGASVRVARPPHPCCASVVIDGTLACNNSVLSSQCSLQTTKERMTICNMLVTRPSPPFMHGSMQGYHLNQGVTPTPQQRPSSVYHAKTQRLLCARPRHARIVWQVCTSVRKMPGYRSAQCSMEAALHTTSRRCHVPNQYAVLVCGPALHLTRVRYTQLPRPKEPPWAWSNVSGLACDAPVLAWSATLPNLASV